MKFRQYLREEALDLALPTDVRSAIVDAGGKIYQVGGAVRDEMLGKVSKDLDLLVVGVDLKAFGERPIANNSPNFAVNLDSELFLIPMLVIMLWKKR